jgi:hypothetical protein
MSSSYTVATLFVVMALLSSVIATSLQQQVFARPDKPSDPCKAFKFLVEYVKEVGLHAVATGDDKEMSNLVDDFQDFSEKILDVSPPDKGKC